MHSTKNTLSFKNKRIRSDTLMLKTNWSTWTWSRTMVSISKSSNNLSNRILNTSRKDITCIQTTEIECKTLNDEDRTEKPYEGFEAEEGEKEPNILMNS